MRCVITVCLIKKFKIHKRSCNCFCLLQSHYQQSVVENQSHQMNHQLLSQGMFDYRGKEIRLVMNSVPEIHRRVQNRKPCMTRSFSHF